MFHIYIFHFFIFLLILIFFIIPVVTLGISSNCDTFKGLGPCTPSRLWQQKFLELWGIVCVAKFLEIFDIYFKNYLNIAKLVKVHYGTYLHYGTYVMKSLEFTYSPTPNWPAN